MDLLNGQISVASVNEIFSIYPPNDCKPNISKEINHLGGELLPPPYPHKSWSFSRYNTLKNCEREYFYQYFLANSAFNPLASERAKLAKQLKHLTTRDLFVGTELHKCIKEVLLNLNKVEYTPDDCKRRIRNSFTCLIDKHNKPGYIDDFRINPSQNLMLQEIYYGGSITDSDIKKIDEKIDACIENFFASETYLSLKNNSKLKILQIEPNIGECTLNLNGVKGFFKLDILYEDECDKSIHVVDWKTGNFNLQEIIQMRLYMYYIRKKGDLPNEKIFAHTEYLKDGTHRLYQPNDLVISSTEELIYFSICEMNKYLLDVNSNQPKSETAFSKCSRANSCKHCKYRELCQ